jgi:hypothetical protein
MNETQSSLKLFFQLNYLQVNISIYSCWLILSIGITTNLFNIYICTRKSIFKETMGFYNPIMSTFNIFALIFGFIYLYPQTNSLLVVSTFSCITISYLGRVFFQISSWLNVMCSFDRMICITYPKRFNFLKNKTILSLIALGIFAFLLVLNVENVFFDLIDHNQTSLMSLYNIQIRLCSSPYKTLVIVRDFIAQFMRTILPVILEFCLNLILIYKLLKSRRNLNVRRTMQRDYKFAFIIVILNIVFLVTHVPLLVCVILLNSLNYSSPNGSISNNQIILNFLVTISGLLAGYMFTSLFFINLAFNRLFKREFYKCVGDLIDALRRVKSLFGNSNPSKFIRSKIFKMKFSILPSSPVTSLTLYKSNTDNFDQSITSKYGSLPVLVKFHPNEVIEITHF